MPLYDVSIGGSGFDAFRPLCEKLFGEKYDTKNESLYESFSAGEVRFPQWAYSDRPTDYDGDGKPDQINSYSFAFQTFYPSKTNPFQSLIVHDTGAVKCSETDSTEYFEWATFDTKVKYSREEALAENPSYQMQDGQSWALADAITYTESFFNDELMKFNVFPVTYQVKDVYIQDLENAAYGYYFLVEFKDNNGSFFDTAFSYAQDYSKIIYNKPFAMPNEAMAYCYTKETFSLVYKGYSFDEYTAVDENPEFLTLSSAIAVLEEKLALKKSLQIPRAELNYVLTCKGYPFYDIWELPKENEEGIDNTWYSEGLCRAKCDFELRPTWRFATEDVTNMDPSVGEVYFVDAITGELSVIRSPYEVLK